MQKEITLKNYANMHLLQPLQQAQIKGGCNCSEEKRRTVRIRKRHSKGILTFETEIEYTLVLPTIV